MLAHIHSNFLQIIFFSDNELLVVLIKRWELGAARHCHIPELTYHIAAALRHLVQFLGVKGLKKRELFQLVVFDHIPLESLWRKELRENPIWVFANVQLEVREQLHLR